MMISAMYVVVARPSPSAEPDGGDHQRSRPSPSSFTGTCPIAYDGQERHYRFTGKRPLHSCTNDLRRVKAVQLVDRLLASLPSK